MTLVFYHLHLLLTSTKKKRKEKKMLLNMLLFDGMSGHNILKALTYSVCTKWEESREEVRGLLHLNWSRYWTHGMEDTRSLFQRMDLLFY